MICAESSYAARQICAVVSLSAISESRRECRESARLSSELLPNSGSRTSAGGSFRRRASVVRGISNFVDDPPKGSQRARMRLEMHDTSMPVRLVS